MHPALVEAKSKCRKVETRTSGRSNRKRVICLHCDKVLNQDNRKYHRESKHKGQTRSFRILSETNQTSSALLLLMVTILSKNKNSNNSKLEV